MDKRIKSHWLRRLRSGKFKQTTQCLYVKKGSKTHKEGMCCLGVLTDLFINSAAGRKIGARWVVTEKFLDDTKATICEYRDNDEYKKYGERESLPSPVVEWAKVEDYDPILFNSKKQPICCSQANDGLHDVVRKHSFKQIAAKIEKNL